MKAVILIGGEGTRLRPLTYNIPKAMVPILNQPFLEHLLHYLEKHGVRDVILAMGYIPAPIQSSLGDGTPFGVRITYLVEESPLGTAGAVKNAESFLDGPFVVFNGDILTEIDLTPRWVINASNLVPVQTVPGANNLDLPISEC